MYGKHLHPKADVPALMSYNEWWPRVQLKQRPLRVILPYRPYTDETLNIVLLHRLWSHLLAVGFHVWLCNLQKWRWTVFTTVADAGDSRNCTTHNWNTPPADCSTDVADGPSALSPMQGKARQPPGMAVPLLANVRKYLTRGNLREEWSSLAWRQQCEVGSRRPDRKASFSEPLGPLNDLTSPVEAPPF